MKRRILGGASALLAACASLAGCETLNQNLRPKADRDPAVTNASGEAVTSDSDKVLDVQADSSKKRPFFQSSRLPSGLSSEARDIESSLGIH